MVGVNTRVYLSETVRWSTFFKRKRVERMVNVRQHPDQLPLAFE